MREGVRLSLRIFILGMLNNEDHHPYDIKKFIAKHTMDQVPFSDGNLYYNFDSLEKKGLIVKKQVVQSDNRPDKTTYGITDEGREHLREEIYAAFAEAKSVQTLYSSLPFLYLVDRNRLAGMVQEKLVKAREKINWLEGNLIHQRIELNDPYQRKLGIFVTMNIVDQLKAELHSFERLLMVLRDHDLIPSSHTDSSTSAL